MTKKQHRKNKQKNLIEKKTYPKTNDDRPDWANDDKIEESNEKWRVGFLAEVKAAVKMRDNKG